MWWWLVWTNIFENVFLSGGTALRQRCVSNSHCRLMARRSFVRVLGLFTTHLTVVWASLQVNIPSWLLCWRKHWAKCGSSNDWSNTAVVFETHLHWRNASQSRLERKNNNFTVTVTLYPCFLPTCKTFWISLQGISPLSLSVTLPLPLCQSLIQPSDSDASETCRTDML